MAILRKDILVITEDIKTTRLYISSILIEQNWKKLDDSEISEYLTTDVNAYNDKQNKFNAFEIYNRNNVYIWLVHLRDTQVIKFLQEIQNKKFAEEIEISDWFFYGIKQLGSVENIFILLDLDDIEVSLFKLAMTNLSVEGNNGVILLSSPCIESWSDIRTSYLSLVDKQAFDSNSSGKRSFAHKNIDGVSYKKENSKNSLTKYEREKFIENVLINLHKFNSEEIKLHHDEAINLIDNITKENIDDNYEIKVPIFNLGHLFFVLLMNIIHDDIDLKSKDDLIGFLEKWKK